MGIAAEVARVRGLTAGGMHGEAVGAALRLARKAPDDREVLFLVALNQRCVGQVGAALETLARLEALHPGYSRVFEERGHCYAALREPGAAVEAHWQAVQINPSLVGSWEALRVLLAAGGQAEEAAHAAAQVALLERMAPEVVAGNSLFADGAWLEAEQIIRPYVAEKPGDVEGWRLLARLAMRADALEEAKLLLEKVLSLAPRYRAARWDYARVLLQSQRYGQARAEAQLLLQAAPQDRDYLLIYAAACVELSDHEEGLRVYRDLLARDPDDAMLQTAIGNVLKMLGQQQAAIACFQQAWAAAPSYGEACWSLANLKTYRFGADEIARMRAMEADVATPVAERVHFCFALGQALEDVGDYAAAFGYYARGNGLRAAELRYQPEIVENYSALQAQFVTRAFLESRAGVGCKRGDPIFIVGMPRAGSTLIEQILASHSQVDGTMELAEMGRIARHLQGPDHDVRQPRYPAVLQEFAGEMFALLGERYLAETAVYRGGKAFFIDKTPGNFRHIGLIHLILPNAKIIDARREAMACCFSNYKQLFAYGHEFSYDLAHLGRYYRNYEALMAHWDAVLPGKILRVQHEDVVGDLEGQVRRILDFCGLAFEPGCVAFHQTARAVRTASSEQVRRPIFADGLRAWENFAPWLGALRAALG